MRSPQATPPQPTASSTSWATRMGCASWGVADLLHKLRTGLPTLGPSPRHDQAGSQMQGRPARPLLLPPTKPCPPGGHLGVRPAPWPAHRVCCSPSLPEPPSYGGSGEATAQRAEARRPQQPGKALGGGLRLCAGRPIPTHMSGECRVCTCPAYNSLSSMGMSTRRPSFSSSLSMMQERGAEGRR